MASRVECQPPSVACRRPAGWSEPDDRGKNTLGIIPDYINNKLAFRPAFTRRDYGIQRSNKEQSETDSTCWVDSEDTSSLVLLLDRCVLSQRVPNSLCTVSQ